MNKQELFEIMSVANTQPNFSEEMNRAWGYYDSKQIPTEVMKIWKDRGQPAIINNYIATTIDSVLGMEAKTRTDLLITPDEYTPENEKIAEGLNKIFYDITHLGRLNNVLSDVYKSQLICGMGFLEIIKLEEKCRGIDYKFKNIDWREVDWDFCSQELDWSDCRWVRRRFWIDADKAKCIFPNHAKEIELAINNFEEFNHTTNTNEIHPDIVGAYTDFLRFKDLNITWTDERKRVLMQVIYVREYYQKTVLDIGGEQFEYDDNNPQHIYAVNYKGVVPKKISSHKIREYWFVGSCLVKEQDCNTPLNNYPIVPFFAYRENDTNVPYGLVRRAMCAQDDINIRHSKATYTMQSKVIIMDADATNMNVEQVRDESNRPDGIILLNPDRRNGTTIKDSLQITNNIQDGVMMYNIMKDAKTVIPDVMGVYSQYLGKKDGVESGVAIANLVEQGSNNLTEINDNYNFGRMLVGDILLSYLLQDYAKKQVTVTVGQMVKRQITLNERQNSGNITNAVAKMRCHITLQDIQSTQVYKQQMASMLVQIMSSASPQFQPLLFPLLVEQLNMPNKEKIINQVNQMLGIPKPQDEMTPDEIQAKQQEQQKAQMEQQLALEKLQLEVSKLQAEINKLNSESERNRGDVEFKRAESTTFAHVNAKTQAETVKLMTEADSNATSIGKTLDDTKIDLAIENSLNNIDEILSKIPSIEDRQRDAKLQEQQKQQAIQEQISNIEQQAMEQNMNNQFNSVPQEQGEMSDIQTEQTEEHMM